MIGFVLAGLIIGALAALMDCGPRRLSPGVALVLGVAGSMLGGLTGNLLGTGQIFQSSILGYIAAVNAAIALILVVRKLIGRSGGDRRRPVRTIAPDIDAEEPY